MSSSVYTAGSYSGRDPSGAYGTPSAQAINASPSLQTFIDRRTQALRDRRRFEPVWHVCQAFLANRQWVGWSRRDRKIVVEPNPQGRERHTVNVLTPYVMTQVGKFVADDLLPRLLFRGDSEEMQAFARQANKAMEYCWFEEVDADERLYEAFLNMTTYGISGVQAHWDPTSGPYMAKQVPVVDGKPMLDPEQARKYVSDNYGAKIDFRDVRGRCSWDVLGPFNILPPPGVTHERNFPWLIIERPVDLSRIRAMFGAKAQSVQEMDLSSIDTVGLRDMIGSDGDTQGAAPSRLRNHALLSTCYEWPTPEHPQGRTVIWSQQTMLEQRDGLPYVIDGEPHVGIRFFKYNRVPGRFWPIGMVEPGIGPQKQRNRSRSQYIEMKDRAGLGRVFAQKNSIKVSQMPGGKIMEVIEVAPGAQMPTETTGTGPGPWLQQDVAMHDADMQKVMGIGDTTMGQAPGGVSAYSAMALLSEQDDKRVGPILKHTRSEIAWLVRYTLNDIRRYWPPNKQVVLAGDDDDQLDAFMFNAAKLPSDVYVKVGTGPPAPRNQAAEIQKIFDLYDRSVSSGTPIGVPWLYESLDAGKAMPLPDSPQKVQTEKADVENMLIARGGVVQVSPMDNHQIHIQEHTNAVEMHLLIPEAAEVVRALQEHIAEHQAMQSQQASAATASPALQGAAGALGGQGPGAPTPPDVPVQFSNSLSPRPGMIDAGQVPGRFGRF